MANKDSLSSMKELIEDLERENFEEIKVNKKVHRPWGHFTCLIKEENWQVKRLRINPNESLSLQMHNFRAENWIVVKGIAKVEINEKIMKKNEQKIRKHMPTEATTTYLSIFRPRVEVQDIYSDIVAMIVYRQRVANDKAK